MGFGVELQLQRVDIAPRREGYREFAEVRHELRDFAAVQVAERKDQALSVGLVGVRMPVRASGAVLLRDDGGFLRSRSGLPLVGGILLVVGLNPLLLGGMVCWAGRG